uniref:TPX2 C-terminal domain-containing protein n=1 Tax=Glossina brevipalpis TaxID=37001 RepID=A0A1A9WU54_9MUSC
MPNFNYYHKKLQKQAIVHNITVPVTPQVMKRSHKTEQTSEQLKEKTEIKKSETQRLKERRQHTTEIMHRNFEERKRQREKEKKKQEEALCKELRKAAICKAPSNPFKK